MDNSENKNKITVKSVFLFLFLMLVSSVMWFMASLNRVQEADILYSVHIKEIPRNVRFLSPDSVSFTLKLKDYGNTLYSYLFSNDRNIVIDYSDVMVADGEINLPISEVTPLIGKQLKKSTRVLASSDNLLNFKVERSLRRRPVAIRDSISLAPSYRVANIEINPDTVWVFGKNASMQECVYTLPVKCNDLRSDVKLKMSLDMVEDCAFDIGEVEVAIDVEPYLRKVVEIPVSEIGFPEGFIVDASPGVLTLAFDVDAKNYHDVSAGDFKVGVYYDDVLASDDYYTKVYLLESPASARDISLSHSKVRCLIQRNRK